MRTFKQTQGHDTRSVEDKLSIEMVDIVVEDAVLKTMFPIINAVLQRTIFRKQYSMALQLYKKEVEKGNTIPHHKLAHDISRNVAHVEVRPFMKMIDRMVSQKEWPKQLHTSYCYDTGDILTEQDKKEAKEKRIRTKSAKAAVMQPKFRSRIARDKTKFTRKIKHKSAMNEEQDRVVTSQEIKQLEIFADNILKKLKIDIEFTNHFDERVNDGRNSPEIKLSELKDLFNKISEKRGGDLKKHKDSEAVIKDVQTQLNLPAVIKYQKHNGFIQVVLKTVMRKKNFKSSNPKVNF